MTNNQTETQPDQAQPDQAQPDQAQPDQAQGKLTEERVSGATTPGSASLSVQVQTVIDESINPAIAMHGGFVNLLRVEDKKVYITMGGGCQGCAASSMTLKSGIEMMILEEIPEIVEVIDETDHSAGDSPFYQ